VELPAIITLIALSEYLFFAFKVGISRKKYNVIAPAVSGNLVWEKLYRVQQNTLEQLIVFIPALWIFSYLVSPSIAAAIEFYL
jgi:glutathione S-transferase